MYFDSSRNEFCIILISMCQTAVPEQHVESSQNCLDNCDLGAFQYSKNLSTRASESTNFQFQILHRRNVIWGLFWKLILGVLGSPNRGNGWFLNFMKSYLYWSVSGDTESYPKKFRWNWTMATRNVPNLRNDTNPHKSVLSGPILESLWANLCPHWIRDR